MHSKNNIIERKLFQTHWHDIYFKDLGIPLSVELLPTVEFYNKYYLEFFKKNKNFSDMSAEWRNNKNATANFLAAEIKNNSKVLSYGCGLGYIEIKLSSLRPDLFIEAYDYSSSSSKWLKQHRANNLFFIDYYSRNFYDSIILVQVLYSIPHKDAVELLKSLFMRLSTNAELIIINTSSCRDENSLNFKFRNIFFLQNLIKLKNLIMKLIFSKSNSQFWGWNRNNAAYISMIEEAGGSILRQCSAAEQSVIISTINKSKFNF